MTSRKAAPETAPNAVAYGVTGQSDGSRVGKKCNTGEWRLQASTAFGKYRTREGGTDSELEKIISPRAPQEVMKAPDWNHFLVESRA
jgi:hypothetical protein